MGFSILSIVKFFLKTYFVIYLAFHVLAFFHPGFVKHMVFQNKGNFLTLLRIWVSFNHELSSCCFFSNKQQRYIFIFEFYKSTKLAFLNVSDLSEDSFSLKWKSLKKTNLINLSHHYFDILNIKSEKALINRIAV